jgi:type IV conjugative transfer system coupling protein TraD
MSGQKLHYVIQGGQTFLHTLRMLWQIVQIVGRVGVISGLLIFAVCLGSTLKPDERNTLVLWSKAQFSAAVLPGQILPITEQDGFHYSMSAKPWLRLPVAMAITEKVKHSVKWMLWCLGGELIVVIGWLGWRGWFLKQAQQVAGNYLAPARVLRRAIKARGACDPIPLATIPIPEGGWQQHAFVHGTTGTGKTQVMQAICDGIRRQGDRAIVYDLHGSFVPYYYREGTDFLLNPLDRRCSHWDLWADCLDDTHYDGLANALIPQPLGTNHDPFWVNGARTVFVAAAKAMQQSDTRSIGALVDQLLRLSLSDLSAILKDSDAGALVSPKAEKTALSIRGVLVAAIKSLRLLAAPGEKAAFSVRHYIAATNDPGWLFVTSRPDHHEGLRSLLTVWLDLVANSLLSLPADPNRRLWFILDELPSLYRLPCLESVLAQSRKFGGCVVLGMQSVHQLLQVYGTEYARAIVDLCNSRVFLRAPSQETALWGSRELGDGEWLEVQQGISYGANTMRDGVSINRQLRQKPAVAVSVLKNLPNLQAIVNVPPLHRTDKPVPVCWPVAKVQLRWKKRAAIAEGFLPVVPEGSAPKKPGVGSEEVLLPAVPDQSFVIQKREKTKQRAKSCDRKKKLDEPDFTW